MRSRPPASAARRVRADSDRPRAVSGMSSPRPCADFPRATGRATDDGRGVLVNTTGMRPGEVPAIRWSDIDFTVACSEFGARSIGERSRRRRRASRDGSRFRRSSVKCACAIATTSRGAARSARPTRDGCSRARPLHRPDGGALRPRPHRREARRRAQGLRPRAPRARAARASRQTIN